MVAVGLHVVVVTWLVVSVMAFVSQKLFHAFHSKADTHYFMTENMWRSLLWLLLWLRLLLGLLVAAVLKSVRDIIKIDFFVSYFCNSVNRP